MRPILAGRLDGKAGHDHRCPWRLLGGQFQVREIASDRHDYAELTPSAFSRS